MNLNIFFTHFTHSCTVFTHASKPLEQQEYPRDPTRPEIEPAPHLPGVDPLLHGVDLPLQDRGVAVPDDEPAHEGVAEHRQTPDGADRRAEVTDT